MPVITYTVPGPVRWTCPAYVTELLWEGWGGGSPGFAVTGAGADGTGGGEYAAQVLTVVPGVTYYGYVGRGGARGGLFGGNTTWSAGQLTAHGAYGITGGTGSSASVHHDGGNGGTASGTGGGGGGASGAPSGAGAAGSAGTSAGGAGGAALASGGEGGHGGNARETGANGTSPGGGGGGAGQNTLFFGGIPTYGGLGGNGQIRLTWSSAPGAPSAYPVPAVPFFPAGWSPSQGDLNTWLHDPFAGLENRPVARFRQAATPQSLPFSGSPSVVEYDTTDEDPLGGWLPSAWSWGPPPGWSGWYRVTVAVATAALSAGNVIRPGIIAPGFTGPVASGYCGTVDGGIQGTFWVYLAGGQDTVQATAALLNAGADVGTSVTAGSQSSMEVEYLAA